MKDKRRESPRFAERMALGLPKTSVEILKHHTDTLDRHERKIADHTAIQTWVAIVNTLVSLLTAGVLAYVAYLQFKTSNRQVELEYAKIAPQWSVTVKREAPDSSVYTKGWDAYPAAIDIKLKRGEARITHVGVLQDLEVSTVIDQRVVNTCDVRIGNYIVFRSDSLSGAPHPKVRQIINEPYRRVGLTTLLIDPGPTWVRIEFEDIFGKKRSVLLGGSEDVLSIVPDKRPVNSVLYETVSANFTPGPFVGARLFQAPETKPSKPDCEAVFAHVALPASKPTGD
jgi:hypothetical protein